MGTPQGFKVLSDGLRASVGCQGQFQPSLASEKRGLVPNLHPTGNQLSIGQESKFTLTQGISGAKSILSLGIMGHEEKLFREDKGEK